MRRDYLFWGLVLVLLGGLLFVNAAGIPLPGGMHAMELFWPSILVLAGAWILLGAFWRGTLGEADGEPRVIALQGARQAALRLEYGAGRLRLGSGATGDQFLAGNFAGSVEEKVRLAGDELQVRLEMGPFPAFLFGGRGGSEWDLRLNRDVPLTLRVETGASQSELDLRDLRVTDLKLSTGASKTDLTLPAAAGTTTVQVELGAASLDIALPAGVAGRIRAEHGVASIEVDAARFPYANGIYESVDYSSAANRADITIQAGVGRVAVR